MSRILDVKNLIGGYGKVQIMNDVDLYVDEGEFVTVIGPNGCGKSTFIKIIFGIATYYSGSVKHKGEEVSGWRTDSLVNRGIAYVPQVDTVFTSLSVRENLDMGGIHLPGPLLNERINEILEMFEDLKPRMSDVAASLSGGQRQMLAISRALISNPDFLLLDEPTAALSVKEVQKILDLALELKAEGIGVIIITHNLHHMFSVADRITVLQNGSPVGDKKVADTNIREIEKLIIGNDFS